MIIDGLIDCLYWMIVVYVNRKQSSHALITEVTIWLLG